MPLLCLRVHFFTEKMSTHGMTMAVGENGGAIGIGGLTGGIGGGDGEAGNEGG